MTLLYRALEFGKLQFLLDEDQYVFWIDKDLALDDESINWWLEEGSHLDRQKVISTVIQNPSDKFFKKSAEFNSIHGGRFNPSKSFGGIYAANSPFVSALEVLFHHFDSTQKLIKPISKKMSAVQAAFNKRLHEMLSVNIVAFELSVDDDLDFFALNEEKDSLQGLCSSLGFDRYFTDSFDRNFIFGNDYEISRIIGCHLHSRDSVGLTVPSARVDFDAQDSLQLRNYFIPEKSLNTLDLRLTERYVEYFFTFSIEPCDDGSYDIRLVVNNNPASTFEFNLEPMPNKKQDPRKQIISYEHSTTVETRNNLREVHLQRFFCKSQR